MRHAAFVPVRLTENATSEYDLAAAGPLLYSVGTDPDGTDREIARP
jgi:hypothetical protein